VRPGRDAKRRWADKLGVCGNDNIGLAFPVGEGVRLTPKIQQMCAHLAEGSEGISCVIVQEFTRVVVVAGERGQRPENVHVPYPQSLDAAPCFDVFG
jgi:hypothetical protein